MNNLLSSVGDNYIDDSRKIMPKWLRRCLSVTSQCHYDESVNSLNDMDNVDFVKKTIDFMENYPKYFRMKLMIGGLTMENRREMWRKAVLTPSLCDGGEKVPNYNEEEYQKLSCSTEGVPEKWIKQIDMDIVRIGKSLCFYDFEKERLDNLSILELNTAQKFCDELRRILVAYAKIDESVGYCQGMINIAGFFLNIFNNEFDGFWFFYNVMKKRKYYLRGIFSDEKLTKGNNLMLANLKDLCNYLEVMLIREAPRVIRKIRKMRYDITLFSRLFSGMLTGFFSYEAMKRIWDCFMYEGWSIILKVIIGVFQQRPLVRRTVEKGTVVECMKEFTLKLHPDQVMRIAKDCRLTYRFWRMIQSGIQMTEKKILRTRDEDEEHDKDFFKIIIN